MAYVDQLPWRAAFAANLLDRLVVQMVEQSEALMRSGDVTIPARAVSTVLFIADHPHASTADIAKALDQPHQLATQRVQLLIDQRIATRVVDPTDARRKVLRLTATGRRQLERLRQRLDTAEIAFAALFEEIGCDLRAVADAAIEALQRTPLVARAASVTTGEY